MIAAWHGCTILVKGHDGRKSPHCELKREIADRNKRRSKGAEMKCKCKMAAAFLLILTLLVPLSLSCGGGGGKGVTITIGEITDLTGPGAPALIPL
jgi:hypothetical protein